MHKTISFILGGFLILASCNEVTPVYPDEPVIDYQSFGLFVSLDELGNKSLVGQLTFNFTDGDGNLGLYPLPDTLGLTLPDTLKYNFFLQLYDLKNFEFEKVPEEEGGILKYRIPNLENTPTSGKLDLNISYPIITHDTIFYTFYIVDQDFNHSNTDSTDVIILSGINLDEI